MILDLINEIEMPIVIGIKNMILIISLFVNSSETILYKDTNPIAKIILNE